MNEENYQKAVAQLKARCKQILEQDTTDKCTFNAIIDQLEFDVSDYMMVVYDNNDPYKKDQS